MPCTETLNGQVSGPAGVDPVTYQVIVSRLSGIVQEMQDSIFRTGYSTIVRESHDASCQILDAMGNLVGEFTVAPLHNTSLPGVVAAIKRVFGDSIRSGDVFISNHPYEADVTHSVDMAVVAPVFVDDELLAFCASIAHKSDLGGPVPGTGNGTATEAFHEGTLFPPVRFMSGDKTMRDIEAILRANSRTPETIMGDIRGQVGVARLGERRLVETVNRYGLAAVRAVFASRLDRTEERLRAGIRAWPDFIAEDERLIDGDTGSGIRFHVRVEKHDDRLSYDFSASSDQVPIPVNVRPPIVRGCVAFIVIGLLDPTIDNNGAVGRVVDVRVRNGSVLDPVFPAPTNAYMGTAMALCELILATTMKLLPEKHVADCGGVGDGLAIAGSRSDGTHFSTYELVGSAFGARSGKDGPSGISALLTNSHAAPIEIMESEFPIRFTRWELIRDSGGAGTFRGGLGPIREYVLAAPSASVTLRGGKHQVPAAGVAGGSPGRLGACIITEGNGGARALPSRFSAVQIARDAVIRLEKSGGGGIGPPAKRDFDRVVADVADGYVSRLAAIDIYGVEPSRLDAAVACLDGA